MPSLPGVRPSTPWISPQYTASRPGPQHLALIHMHSMSPQSPASRPSPSPPYLAPVPGIQFPRHIYRRAWAPLGALRAPARGVPGTRATYIGAWALWAPHMGVLGIGATYISAPAAHLGPG